MNDNSLSLRQAMNHLHEWAGVLFSALLMVIFFMGTLTVFMHEIDRYMVPEARATEIQTTQKFSFDKEIRPHFSALSGNESSLWFATIPNDRNRLARLFWVDENGAHERFLDVQQQMIIPKKHSYAASEFFYPMHTHLLINSYDMGVWIVGVASISMLVLLVSGVIIHRKFFAEFLTFRPHKTVHRKWLDLHNLTSVLALP